LDALKNLLPEVVQRALADPHPGVRRHAVQLSEQLFWSHPQLGEAVAKLIDDADPQVTMQVAYSLGEWKDPRAGAALGTLARRLAGHRYRLAAVASSLNKDNLDAVAEAVVAGGQAPPAELVENLFRTARGLRLQRPVVTLLSAVAKSNGGRYAPWQF